ncbi:hypothetical protein [Amphritea japonica]|uniref:hypothetical protein n=1 Tax=Amphritea japonica TaxID=452627 RepID=UPI0012E9A173|nr:hypothetical protein [Amphritea japonica]
MDKAITRILRIINITLITVFIAGCFSDDNEYISVPVLSECEEFSESLISKIEAKGDYRVELRKFYRKPVSHSELYGYLNIYTGSKKISSFLRQDLITFEAYCYADTEIASYYSVIPQEVSDVIEKRVSGSYREDGVYIKVDGDELYIYLNKLDSSDYR